MVRCRHGNKILLMNVKGYIFGIFLSLNSYFIFTFYVEYITNGYLTIALRMKVKVVLNI